MALARWAPSTEMARFRDEMDRLFENFLRPWQSQQGTAGQWLPSVNVYDRDGNVVVEASIPGARREDVHASVEDHSLVLSGEVRHEESVKEEDFTRHEISCGRFERYVPLPSDVNADQAKAEFHDGLLRVTLPKVKEEAKGRKISIEG